jgi:hypothetical protein
LGEDYEGKGNSKFSSVFDGVVFVVGNFQVKIEKKKCLQNKKKIYDEKFINKRSRRALKRKDDKIFNIENLGSIKVSLV